MWPSVRLNGLLISLLALLSFSFFSWYSLHEETSCTVQDAGRPSVNGFYAAFGGIYIKRGYELTYIPDIFGLLALQRSISGATIAFSKRQWTIHDHIMKDPVYSNSPPTPERYIYNPPGGGWESIQASDLPAPQVGHCKGSLETSVPINAQEVSNIGQLLQRPVTTLLLGFIFAVAYYLWAFRIDVGAVAYSYDAVLLRGEYWRGVTASFAHYDLMHLGFNTMALYSLGSLEAVYGSSTFLYLSLDLVVVTMILCTAMYHVMITQYGRSDMASQLAVGYSCVLFAWMVALSVRLKEYCPIFILPSVCIDTWQIPIPEALTTALGLAAFTIPLNIGPFGLLLFTKIIMPRSSFIGHLSGIIIGYPLAWNMLNWLTPPLLLSALTLAYIYCHHLYIWTFPGFPANTVELSEFVAPHLLRYYKILQILTLFLLLAVPTSVYFMGFGQLIPRLSEVFIAWSAVQACRCEWVTGLGSVRDSCGNIMALAVVFMGLMLLYDVCTLAATLSGAGLVLGCGITWSFLLSELNLLGSLCLAEVCFCLLLLGVAQEARSAAPILVRLRLDDASVVSDLKILCPTGVQRYIEQTDRCRERWERCIWWK
ncbi:hypothetical protein B484DRAFT_256829 [Ochromonadaceae sp. CCMP2298]|nr:hypothetical protein B484DRAFT_256829 [Ochromonadaceae sp. CCMP2298]